MGANPIDVAKALPTGAFLSGLQFRDEKGQWVRFNKPSRNQRHMLRDLTAVNPDTGRPHSTVVSVASRQMGKSTLALGHELCRLYQATDPVSTLLATNYDTTNTELWERLGDMYTTLPPELRRSMIRSNQRILQFADSRAKIRCVSSKSPAGVRSGTFQRFIGDEVAYWHDAEALNADITSAMHVGPHSQSIYVSTPNGPGGLFHEIVRKAQAAVLAGDPDVRFHFWKWTEHDSYTAEPPRGWEPEQDEVDLAIAHEMTLGQLWWRRQKIRGVKGIGLDRFRREYPLTVDEGFLTFAGGWFDTDYLNALSAGLAPVASQQRVWHPPQPGRRYVAGIDPSWCNGGDYAVCQILDEDGEQCAVLGVNTGGELAFADDAAALCAAYKARAMCEWNPGGAGPVIIRRLAALGVKLWERPLAPGKSRRTDENTHWTTSHGSKESAYSHARNMVNNDRTTINDWQTLHEMMHIREVNGVIGGQDGVTDDHAMAYVLALENLKTLPAPPVVKPGWSRRKVVAAKDPWAATRLG